MNSNKENIKCFQPYFICVGPHKTGTTWLNKVIGRHREIKRTALKEINYFSYRERIRTTGKVRTQLEQFRNTYRRKIVKKRFIRYFEAAIKGNIERRIKQQVEYELRRLTGRFTLNYYKSLFYFTDYKMGDITPQYYHLEKKTIQEIKQIFPQVKVLLFLREPISRLWSHTKMYFKNHPNFPRNRCSYQKLVDDLLKYDTAYPDIGLQNWLEVFDKEQLFIGFYEDLTNDPVDYFTRICRFLEISDDLDTCMEYQGKKRTYIRDGVQKTVEFQSAQELISFRYNNSQFDLTLPDDIKLQLANYYTPKVQQLLSIYDHTYPKQWLEKYEQIKKNPSLTVYK